MYHLRQMLNCCWGWSFFIHQFACRSLSDGAAIESPVVMGEYQQHIGSS